MWKIASATIRKHSRRFMIAVSAAAFVLSTSVPVEGRIIINEVNMGSQDYFEIFNYSLNPVDLTGYSAELWDSGLGGLNPSPVIGFPSLSLAANSMLTFHENANVAAGEIDTPNMYMWHGRDLSIVIRNPDGDIVDLWAHGNNFFGPPDADPNTTPINTINTNTNGVTYQRFLVENGNGFQEDNWASAASSRNNFNTPVQVVAVPEPSTWVFSLIGITLLGGMWFFQRKDQPAVDA